MGYFSEKAINITCREDRSYPSPVQQQLWRQEDLWNRLEEVGQRGETGARYTPEDLAYALPEDLHCREAILAAIAVTASKLGPRFHMTGERAATPDVRSITPATAGSMAA